MDASLPEDDLEQATCSKVRTDSIVMAGRLLASAFSKSEAGEVHCVDLLLHSPWTVRDQGLSMTVIQLELGSSA